MKQPSGYIRTQHKRPVNAARVNEKSNKIKDRKRCHVLSASLVSKQHRWTQKGINWGERKIKAVCLLGTNNGQQVVYGQHGDHAVTSPWTEICGTHLSAVVWQSRLLSLHLPWHNQQKLWLVGPPVTYTDKLQQPIRAQKGCPDHVCGHWERCDLLFQLFFFFWGHFQYLGLDFLGQSEHSGVGEAHGRRTAAATRQGEIYLFKLPAVRHRGHHLCQLLLLALQHPVHMLHRNLGTRTHIWQKRDAEGEMTEHERRTPTKYSFHLPVMFYSRVPWSCPWWALLMMWCCRILPPLAHLKQEKTAGTCW